MRKKKTLDIERERERERGLSFARGSIEKKNRFMMNRVAKDQNTCTFETHLFVHFFYLFQSK